MTTMRKIQDPEYGAEFEKTVKELKDAKKWETVEEYFDKYYEGIECWIRVWRVLA